MSVVSHHLETWQQENQQYLASALSDVKAALERHARGSVPGSNGTGSHRAVTWAIDPRPALDTLCATFGLSPFERSIVVLCAGMELDSSVGSLCAAAQGTDENMSYPTFSLALAALPDGHWSAITPAAPLRFWRMIELSGDRSLTRDRLRIDERILHYLTGVQYIDERLTSLAEPVSAVDDVLSVSQTNVAQRIVSTWESSDSSEQPPVVHLFGVDGETRRAIAVRACRDVGVALFSLLAGALPLDSQGLESFSRLWEREAALSDCALLLDCSGIDETDRARHSALAQFVERARSIVLVSSPEARAMSIRNAVPMAISPPTFEEQMAIWQRPVQGQVVDPRTTRALASQFAMNPVEIERAKTAAIAASVSSRDLRDQLWRSCSAQRRPRLEHLAQRIEPRATWSDLVLPEPQLQSLREVAIHVRERSTVYQDWGFARRYSRGLGVSLLCAGPSGTGKTMAAEVLANDLRLDLYRIDLSEVVSKYIGETEKNLSRLFAAAEGGGAILLFDEADALFGKRSEIKDSHDRYANIEISYLLQRMETFEGLSILTTNMKDALDTAFLRRLRFVVQFPFPDTAQRELIWKGIFPPETPTRDLDTAKLARLNLSGGLIRNVAMNAAFLAADDREPVSMRHLAAAARSEHAKMEKPLNEAEIGTWR